MVHDSKSLTGEKPYHYISSAEATTTLKQICAHSRMSLLVQGLCPLCSRGGPQGVPNLPLTHPPQPRSWARSLWAAAMVRVRVCPNLAGGPAAPPGSDLTSVRLAGHPPHPQRPHPGLHQPLLGGQLLPAKRTLDRTQPGARASLVSHGCRPFFGFCFGLHVFYPEIRELSVGGEGCLPLPPRWG